MSKRHIKAYDHGHIIIAAAIMAGAERVASPPLAPEDAVDVLVEYHDMIIRKLSVLDPPPDEPKPPDKPKAHDKEKKDQGKEDSK